MVWNIRKVVRYGDVLMILDKKSLRLGGNILIDKVDVSILKTYYSTTPPSSNP